MLPAVFPLPPGIAWVRGAEPPTAAELMRRMDELWRGDASHARMTMQVRTRNYTRSMTLESWSRGKEHSLIRILSPKKDEGIATLKVSDNIWNYLPNINRVTKVPASMMGGAWMGSHFTNDDLVRESSFESDYTSTVTFSGEREGVRVYEITSRPRPDAAVVWGKLVTVLTQEGLLPVRTEYFDESEVKVRVMTFSNPVKFSGRLVPSRMELRPLDKPEEFTAIDYEALEFNPALPENLFSLQRLQGR
ncbi:MAG: outer membrane lipoprotein-sorting protein [Deltaproteobacteria bacterium]|nr:outer membrane lipoprotein-sorting protein [Deltaproteobacteria bacterium]